MMSLRPRKVVEAVLGEHETELFEDAPDIGAWLASQSFDLFIVVLTAVIVLVADDGWVSRLGVIGLALMTLSLLWRAIDRSYTRYILTDYRAIRVSGVLRRDYEWMAWSKVTDVSVHRSPFDRLFGTATIKIQSANEASGFKAMTDISHPAEFADWVLKLVSARQGSVNRLREAQ